MTAVAPVAPTTAKPKPAITRDRYHRYTYQGQTYPGVTSILRVLDKSDALMAWASRNTAEAALAQLDHLAGLRDTVGPDGVIKALTARLGLEARRGRGSGLRHPRHGRAHRPGRAPARRARRSSAPGSRPTPPGGRARAGVSGWPRPSSSSRPWATAARSTCSPTTRPDGPSSPTSRSGANVYPEVVLQLLAYGEAALIAPQGSPLAYPMPAIERYVVLHVTDTGVRVIDVEVDDDDRAALRACLPLSRWHTAMKGQRL